MSSSIRIESAQFIQNKNVLSTHTHLLGRKEKLKFVLSNLRLFISHILLNRKSISRELDYVSDIYADIYSQSNKKWAKKRIDRREYYRTEDNTILVNGFYLMDYYTDILTDVIEKTNSNTILEVGSGRGNNTMVLAMKNPNVRVTGLEYNQSGVQKSKSLLNDISDELVSCSDRIPAGTENATSQTQQRVKYVEGNAFDMDFEDNSFDLSFTCLVLEQMPHKYEEALSEMRRVTKNLVVFLEPFSESNGFFGKAVLSRKDYFKSGYKKFTEHGLEPIQYIRNVPQKIRWGMGILIAKIL